MYMSFISENKFRNDDKLKVFNTRMKITMRRRGTINHNRLAQDEDTAICPPARATDYINLQTVAKYIKPHTNMWVETNLSIV